MGVTELCPLIKYTEGRKKSNKQDLITDDVLGKILESKKTGILFRLSPKIKMQVKYPTLTTECGRR